MLVAAIIGQDSEMQTAELINSIMTSAGKKVGIIDFRSFCFKDQNHHQGNKNNCIELDTKKIKCYVNELDKNNTDVLLLKINILDINNGIFDYLNFDIIIYNDKADDLREGKIGHYRTLMRRLFSLLKDKGVAIVNVDNSDLIRILHGMRHQTVTYGFNSKASITTSSIGDTIFKDGFMCCLQRTISAKDGQVIEPQEFKIRLETGETDAYNVLAAATFAIVNGIDLNTIN